MHHQYTECEVLHGSLTFDVSVPSPRSVGVVAQYTCEVGYQFASASTQRICQSSLAWDGIEPTCTKATCPDNIMHHQVCYNCDIADGSCPFVSTPATLDECRTAAINSSALFIEHDASICKTFSCQVPQIKYTNGHVALFSSCNEGLIILHKNK